MASRSERVLVTGARGFTGRYLCAHLRASGYEVVGLVESGPVDADEVLANLLDSAATTRAVEQTRPDRVIHLAAVSSVTHDDVEAIYRTNVLGSLALLRALSAGVTGLRSVILASSANVYGNVTAADIEESMPCAPTNHYAASKLAMEHMARVFADTLPIVVARPFNYTGPGQSEDFLMPKIVSHFKRRASVIELGNIDVTREFMDVRTVVDIYLRLLECPAAVGKTVNISLGRGISLREAIRVLEAETGYRPEIRVDPQLVRAREIRTLVGSPRLLESLIGQVSAIPFAETLRNMLAHAASSEGAQDPH